MPRTNFSESVSQFNDSDAETIEFEGLSGLSACQKLDFAFGTLRSSAPAYDR